MRLRYLPALDGLRGLAVLLVIAFHLELNGFDGGFIGVDVFFVLSGFLITSLLLGERESRGTISLVRFWSHRLRRLLPALLLLLLVVGMLLPTLESWRRAGVRWDALSALAYVTNWRFVAVGATYAQANISPSPLQHLWSLAIEEQFYLVWPAAIAAGTALVRSRRSRVALLAVVLALIAISATLLAAGFDRFDPSRTYFSTHTRMFEPLLGALLAMVVHPRQFEARTRSFVAADVAGTLGLIAIVTSAITLQFRSRPYYQGGALVVCLATGAVILASLQRGWCWRVLSIAPLRSIGKVSYGLYLWHWPVLVYLDASRTGLSGVRLFVLRAAVTIGITLASYFLLELPIRAGSWRQLASRPRRVFAGAFASAVTVAVAVVLGASGATSVPVFLSESGGFDVVTSRTDTRSYALIGDSVARSLVPGFESAVRERNGSFARATFGGCAVGTLIRVDEDGAPFYNAEGCSTVVPRAQRAIVARIDPDVIFWYSQRERYGVEVDGSVLEAGSAEWERAVFADWDATLQRLTTGGATVVVVLPAYGVAKSTAGCEDEDPRVALARDECRADSGALTGGPLRGFYRRWATLHANDVVVVDASPIACDQRDPCPPRASGVELRPFDGIHFSAEGARWLAPRLLASVSG